MPRFLIIPFGWGGVCAAILLLSGCEGADGRRPVSGAVMCGGKPVVYGTISFDPDTTKGVDGPQGSAEIRNGRYKTAPEWGARSGAHIVNIVGWDAAPEAGMLGAPICRHTTQADVSAAGGVLDFDVPPAKVPPRK